jgi:hypothetical protein
MSGRPPAREANRAASARELRAIVASVAVFVAALSPLFVVSGVAARSLVLLHVHAVLFYLLPGLALVSQTRWLRGDPLLVAIWALAAGVAAQPLWLTPLWMANAVNASWGVPVAAAIVLLARRERIGNYLRSEAREWPFAGRIAAIAGLGLFAALGAWLGVMHPFATTPIDPHFATQGSIVRNLADGWPPMNQLLEGVPLSYNYGLHLGLLILAAFWPVDLVEVVARIAPVFFLQLAILVFMAFARSVLRMRWRYAALAAVSVFWVVGFGPVNAAIFGAVLPSASTYVVSSLGAFIAFFVALRFLADRLSDERPHAWRDALVVAALAFSVTALRGQGGAILVCVVAFTLLPPLARERRVNAIRAGLLAAAIAGMVLALRIFFTLGGGFSGVSFIEVGQTFTWLADQNAFWIVERLERGGASAWIAGAAGFAVIALMQAKFLAPAFVYQCARMRRGASPGAFLLAGAALAGICGTMLTHSPGGSHFSFIHYATLSMALLGALGVERLVERAASPAGLPRPSGARATLALVVLIAAAGAWDLASQLGRFRARLFAGPPVLHPLPQVTPLLARLGARDLVVPLLRAADQVPGIEAEWGMVYGVRFMLYGNLLREYAGWKNRLQTSLGQRLAAAVALENSAAAGALRAVDLEALALTLARPQERFYVIAPSGLQVAGAERIRVVAGTDDYTLYSYVPAAGLRPGNVLPGRPGERPP